MSRNAPTVATRTVSYELYPTNVAPKSAQDEFTARIASWLSGIEPLAPSCESETALRKSRSKTRQPKPYSRPEEQRHPSHGSASTDEVMATGVRDTRQNILDLRSAARIDRSLRSLPHPLQNPLVTGCSEDLQAEYARIVLLYNEFEEKKQQAELHWQHRPSISCLQDITDLEKSSRRIIDAAQYIVDFAYTLRIDIDFGKIFLRYRSSPLQNGKVGSDAPRSQAFRKDDSGAYPSKRNLAEEYDLTSIP